MTRQFSRPGFWSHLPRTVGQVPIYYNQNTGRPPDAANRYSSECLDMPCTPRYPFGYGLSCTKFSYLEPRLGSAVIKSTDSVTVQVMVTNTGHAPVKKSCSLHPR